MCAARSAVVIAAHSHSLTFSPLSLYATSYQLRIPHPKVQAKTGCFFHKAGLTDESGEWDLSVGFVFRSVTVFTQVYSDTGRRVLTQGFMKKLEEGRGAVHQWDGARKRLVTKRGIPKDVAFNHGVAEFDELFPHYASMMRRHVLEQIFSGVQRGWDLVQQSTDPEVLLLEREYELLESGWRRLQLGCSTWL